ncbi:MAG: protein kinase [Planctomycetota bacterium]
MLDRFQLIEKIGEGAHATVWRAEDTKLDRQVAVKLLRFAPTHHCNVASRFEQEIQAAARLKHDNIVTLLEAGTSKDIRYIVYELIDGVTFREWNEFVKPTHLEIVLLLSRVADAIGYAHAQGIVHRDIKPENIIVDLNGTPYVADFGLAQIADNRITEGDVSVGTVAYLAPEQCSQSSVDGRADIFSMGVVLFETLVGELPFRAFTRAEYVAQVMTSDAPELTRINREIHPDLAAICSKALSLDLRQRYSSAEQFQEDLRRFADGQPTIARPLRLPERMARYARRHITSLIAAIVAIICLIGLGLYALTLEHERRIRTLNDVLEASNPEALEILIGKNEPNRRLLPVIREALEIEESTDQKLNLLYAISRIDRLTESETQMVLDITARAAKRNPRILVPTLESIPGTRLREYFESPSFNAYDARSSLVIVAMCLGFEQYARPLVRVDRNQEDRYDFLSNMAKCDLSAEQWIRCMQTSDNELLACVVAAAGESSITSNDDRSGLIAAVTRILQNTEHAGVHSAAQYGLRRLGIDSKGIASRNAQHGEWFTHPAGVKFISIPAGSVEASTNDGLRELDVQSGFYVSAVEIPQRLVAEWFSNDSRMEFAVKGAKRPFDEDVAAHALGVAAAMLICNELSVRDNRTPYYLNIDFESPNATQTDANSMGYRIPTRSQWEWMCRSGTSTEYFYGSKATLSNLHRGHNYGWFVRERRQTPDFRSGGLKRPNSWGIFDVYGNVDEIASQDDGAFVVCGGNSNQPAATCHSSYANTFPLRNSFYGLRVVCPNPRKYSRLEE